MKNSHKIPKSAKLAGYETLIALLTIGVCIVGLVIGIIIGVYLAKQIEGVLELLLYILLVFPLIAVFVPTVMGIAVPLISMAILTRLEPEEKELVRSAQPLEWRPITPEMAAFIRARRLFPEKYAAYIDEAEYADVKLSHSFTKKNRTYGVAYLSFGKYQYLLRHPTAERMYIVNCADRSKIIFPEDTAPFRVPESGDTPYSGE